MLAMRPIRHTLHVLIAPAHDVPGQWLAHCLELDVVSQGNSAPHALDMIAEAIELLAESNVKAGKPPLSFHSAPLEEWEAYKNGEEAAVRPLRIAKPIDEEITIDPRQRACQGA